MGRTKRMVRDAFLISAALVVYVIEAQLPPLAPVPGIKLGVGQYIYGLCRICRWGPETAWRCFWQG